MSTPFRTTTSPDNVAAAAAAATEAVSPAQAVIAAVRPTSHWPAIFSLSMGVFGLVMAEFLPASLLTAMSTNLRITDGAAGQAVTATALIGAIAALSMPILTRRLDRKHVMLALSALLVLSNVLAATAANFPMLLAARVILGISLGGFWSMSAALALRLVPEDQFARAMSVILTGMSVATVCAAPVGAWMGGVWGWRSAFLAASVVSVATLISQIFTLPALAPRGNPNLRVMSELLRRPSMRVALLAMLLAFSGHFAGFTYVRPLMEQVTHLSVSAVSGVLLGYGIGGFFGNIFGGWLAGRSERNAIVFGGTLIAVLAAVLLIAGTSAVVTAVAVTLWGFAFGAFPVGFQTWIVRAASDHAESAGGLLVAVAQIAIATGAIGGGLMVDGVGALGGPAFALVALTLATALTLRFGPRPIRT